MSKFHQAKSFLSYWLNAVNEHSLHAPFIYDLFKKVIGKKHDLATYQSIEAIRDNLCRSTHTVNIKDYGAGSGIDNGSTRKVADIAKYGITKPKYSRLLGELIKFTESQSILELGTSLGINSLYLSQHPNTHVITMEGAPGLVNLAETLFEAQNRNNIKVVEGNIDERLVEVLSASGSFDFVFFDANHTEKATLRYFEQCLANSKEDACFVFDDIHWSKEMEKVWAAIKNHYQVTLTVDVYQMGIVFFNPDIRKQHYVLQY
ncbi:class I SAM-dependent methyltransferase [Fulvivirga sp. RKSG066]|uniref:O-methyltransferase n=1 Tax=Fulvivirga aurantia TaxID=2529383 RepID=UPI0012BC23FC|nr:class I SAM-dependent methyltransferase [Fulvivirga aurantia]MTI19876.1 class I SAM-dependent methyltransferase [Fulvivirga aurantia]